MTDNEIIKVWEKVLNNSDEPIGEHWMVFVTTQIAKETFDMLNRQKAEIEILQKRIVFWREDLNYQPEKERAEAVKEFAERLKDTSEDCTDWGHPYVLCEDIDRLVEDMVGGTDE